METSPLYITVTEKTSGFKIKLPLIKWLTNEVTPRPPLGENSIYAIPSGDRPKDLPDEIDGIQVRMSTSDTIVEKIEDEICIQLGLKNKGKYAEQIQREANNIWNYVNSKTENFPAQYTACWVNFYPSKTGGNLGFRSEVIGPETDGIDELVEKFRFIQLLSQDRMKRGEKAENGLLIIVCPKNLH